MTPSNETNWKKDGQTLTQKSFFHLIILLFALICSVFTIIHPMITFHSQERIIQAVPEKYDLKRIRTFQALFQTTSRNIEHVIVTPSQRREFLVHHGIRCDDRSSDYSVLETYDRLGSLADQQDTIEERYHVHYLQLELWKFCVLGSGYASTFVDYDTVDLLQSFERIFPRKKINYIIRTKRGGIVSRTDETQIIDGDNEREAYIGHTALIVLGHLSSGRNVAISMVQWIIQSTCDIIFELNDAKKHRSIFSLDILLKQNVQLQRLAEESTVMYPKEWEWLENECSGIRDNSTPLSNMNLSLLRSTGFRPLVGRQADYCSRDGRSPCCEVRKQRNEADRSRVETVLLLQHPLAPKRATLAYNSIEQLPFVPTTDEFVSQNSERRLPYLQHEALIFDIESRNGSKTRHRITPKEVTFMSIARAIPISPSEDLSYEYPRLTPSFFDILVENDCLPKSDRCLGCLQKPPVADPTKQCEQCEEVCGCYCRVLCNIRPNEKQILKEIHVFPPIMKRNEDRLIPKIVHQTWFEDVKKEKYPRMSKIVNSWKESGWEYSFYDDEESMEFLSMHYPKEVKEAYASILPGAFKADLFRYCVLLIRGGVYADMDVLLSADLDVAIPSDVGLMTGIDEPGIELGHRYCLWNGFLAAAPGHPIIAKTIEMVVNNIRNRFTGMDIDDMFCPHPVLSVAHAFDLLHVTGPCIFGAAVNSVLGKHMQSDIAVGEIDIWEKEHELAKTNTSDIPIHPDDPRLSIPGRMIILSQNKEDMGCHRFTFLEKNLIIASTDLPDSKDPRPVIDGVKEIEHYSDFRNYRRLYGVNGLYKDSVSEHELIRIVVRKVA